MEQTMIAILEKFNVKFCVRSISADNTSANTAFVRSFLARLETELVAERGNRRESGSGAVMYGPRLPQTLFPTFVEGWDYMIGCGGHVIALGVREAMAILAPAMSDARLTPAPSVSNQVLTAFLLYL